MKSVMLVLLACVGLSACVVVPDRVARVERRDVYVAPSTTYVYPYDTYSYSYYRSY